MSKPWMRIPKETPKAFEAFCIYRDLGPGRTIPEVQSFYSKSPSYIRQLHEWSRTNDWVERATAFDDMIAERTAEASADRAVRAAARHADAGKALVDKGLEALKAKPVDMMTVDGIRGLIGDGVKIERLSLGLVTDNTKQEVSGNVNITNDRIQQVLADPEASRLACDLTERIGAGTADPGLVRDARESRPMEAGKAPRLPEP
jgi:hypothetical protein